jgi:hypothetical protein
MEGWAWAGTVIKGTALNEAKPKKKKTLGQLGKRYIPLLGTDTWRGSKGQLMQGQK